MEIPITIEKDNILIHGILNVSDQSDDLLIITAHPYWGSKRTGLQRSFVELSRVLINHRISTLRIDFPETGDGYNYSKYKYFDSNYALYLYPLYLSMLCEYLDSNYTFKRYMLFAHSAGCIPVLNFALSNQIFKMIFLNPDDYSTELFNYEGDIIDYLTEDSMKSFNGSNNSYFKNELNFDNDTRDPKVLCVFNDQYSKQIIKSFTKIFDHIGFSYEYKIIENSPYIGLDMHSKNRLIDIVSGWITSKVKI